MSIIRAIKHRLGLSVTPANNFTFDASADNGTMKLARESGQDIMTVDAAGKVAFPQNTPVGFIATQATIGLATSGTLPTGTEQIDNGNCFDTSTYKFQPSVAGWYSISASSVFVVTSMQYAGIGIIKNAAQNIAKQIQPPYAGSTAQVSCATEVYMNGTTDYCLLNYNCSPTGGTASDVRFSASLAQRG